MSICVINIISRLPKTSTYTIQRNNLFLSVKFFSNNNFYVLKNNVRLQKQKQILLGGLHKADFHRYSPTSIAAVNKNNSNIDTKIPRENSFTSLQISYILVEFEVTYNVNVNTHYADNTEICLVDSGPFALFSDAPLSTSSKKHLEKVENLHTASLMQKFLSSSANSKDLLYEFYSNITQKRHDLTNIKEAGQKVVFCNRIR